MRGLVTDGRGAVSIQEMPMPLFGPRQALVRMISCGICNGTDTKLIDGRFKHYHAYPAVLGHEGYGEVVAVGEAVVALHVGDRVLLPFLEETTGVYESAWGALAEYAVVGDAQAYQADGLPFPEGYLAQTVLARGGFIDDITAPMIVTFREVLAAIRRFELRAEHVVAVFGAGPVGLCFIRMAKLLGVKTVIAVDIADDKVAAALTMGADAAMNSGACDVSAEIRALAPGGLDRVIDAVGINALINQAMGLISDHGKICCYGISAELSMALNWADAPYNWSLNFVQWPSKREEGEAHAQVMSWIEAGQLDPRQFVSHVFSFDNAVEAFTLVRKRGADVKKIIVTF